MAQISNALKLATFFCCFLICGAENLFAGTQTTLAVLITSSPTLSDNEKKTLQNIISAGFADTKKYQIVDADTLNQMLEDEVTEALLLGNESKLDKIQKKYQVDVLVNISSKIDSISAIAGYCMASATVTISCRRKDSSDLFDIKTSEPQNGYYGMPEWIGTTNEAARKIAMHAAVADIFQQADIYTVQLPFPARIDIQASAVKLPKHRVVFFKKYSMTKQEANHLTQLAKDTMGRRSKIMCSVLDSGKRIGAVGITKIDIDLQRHRRLDTAEFQVFDYRKRRNIRTFELPREIEGIRRLKSRNIVDFAFAPTGRFLALVSKHPALWIYDNLSGTMLCSQKIAKEPYSVSFSTDGKLVQVGTGTGEVYYKIDKKK